MRWLNIRRKNPSYPVVGHQRLFFSHLSLVLTENNLILNFHTYNELMFVLVIPPFLTLSSWKNCVPSFHRLRWTFDREGMFRFVLEGYATRHLPQSRHHRTCFQHRQSHGEFGMHLHLLSNTSSIAYDLTCCLAG
jgi:hypothetical protein